MLVRSRWFILGAASAIGATAIVVSRARAMRERLDARGVARIGADLAADGLELAGRRLQRSAIRIAPNGSGDRVG